MSILIEMDYDEWFDTYKPIPNHIDENASFSDGEYGYMFETYGDELTFIQRANDNVIWTYGDGDDGGTYIWSGYSFVNRIGYFITERPWVNDVQALVIPADDELDNDEDEE
jgi:hypothetical protein